MKRHKIISIIMVVIVLFSSIAVFSEESEETKKNAYDAGYSVGQGDAERLDIMPSRSEVLISYKGKYPNEFYNGYIDGFTAGKSTYGKQLGGTLGAIHGEKDYKNNLNSDWSRNLPSDDKIVDMYNLRLETNEYRLRFILEFKEAYEDAYLKAYENANFKPITNASDIGKADGTSIGSTLGSFFGRKDAEEEKNIDFNRHLPDNDVIIVNYNLNKDTKEYRDAFITYFKIAFRESYEKSYRETNIGNINEAARKDGRTNGFKDGKKLGEHYKEANQLKPYSMIRPTDEEILKDYKNYLSGKNQVYINDFLIGYHEGFKEGYESVIANESVYQAGYTKGYNDGKALATKSNSDKTFIPYDKVKLDRNQAITLNYDVLKDKNQDYIMLFIDGYLVGYEKGYKETIKVGEDEKKETITIYGAEDFGTVMGRIDGYIAYNSGSKNNWEKYVPNDRKLTDMFELNKESREYRDGFIEAFRKSYKEAFEGAYQVAKLGEKDYSYEQGLKDGDEYARDIATLNGQKDYFLGLSNDYRRNMPSNREIIEMFNLNNDTKEYRDAFLTGFEYGSSTSGGKTDGGYMLYYTEAYRAANKETIETPDANGEEGGRTIGRMKGEYAAILDITMGKANLWTSHKVKDDMIINEYGLQFQSPNYRNAFIIGYWNEFMKSYNETYKRLQQDSNRVKTHTEKISIDGKQNVGIPSDDKFLVDIEAGTYYNDVIVTIDSIPTSYVNPNSSRHTQASGVYGLKIMNLSGTFDKNKKITIKFKSYGKDVRYGIYKYHYNKWIYIPCRQEGDYLVADINLNNINLMGNIYAVRVDNELPIFHESRGHWARDEINTYVKREIIYGYPDKSFKPDREISRGEFVTMLSRLYDWYPPYDSTNVTKFKDYKEFGYAEKAISYATYYKIVNGYPDNTFRPHNSITYKEVEIIMNRVLGTKNFKWIGFAEKMIYEKKVRSKSFDSMNNKITRAEFTFLLYHLNEWQY